MLLARHLKGLSWLSTRQYLCSSGNFSAGSLQRSLSNSSRPEDFPATKIQRVSENSLSRTVTPELEQQIVGEALGQKFILKQVLSEIIYNEGKKYPLPLPASLTVEQWKTLISLTDRRSRFFYLDSLMFGKKTLEEIQEYDEKFTKPLKVPQEMIDQVVGEDSDARKKIDMFLMIHEMARQEGEEVPPELKLKDLKDIVRIKSRNGHRKFLNFLNTRIQDDMKDMRRKSYSKSKHDVRVKSKQTAVAETDHIYYGLGHNTIMLRLSDQTLKKELDWRVWREFSLGSSPLLVDFSYVSNIQNNMRVKSLVQTEAAHGIKMNKEAKTPFPLHFTGVSPELQKWMKRFYFIDEDGSNFPVEITEKHQTELFPKEKLVYLSPDSKNDLWQFDDDDIYVIGGLIDKGQDYAPLTLANAKRNKIRHARFPMRRTIGLASDLNVETCIAIMNDMKFSNDWFYSFRWVPSRFFYHRASEPGATHQHRLSYRAHQALSPPNAGDGGKYDQLQALSPRHYRELYRRIMESQSREETNKILEFLEK